MRASRRRTRLGLAVGFAVAAAHPGVAAAAHPGVAAAAEAGHGPNWLLLGLQVLNLGILLFVLVRYAGRPVSDFLVQRSRAVRDGIRSAEARLGEARQRLDGVRERLEHLEEEARGLLALSEEQAGAERERLLERTEAAAARIREEAQRVADYEIERARRALRDEAAALALDSAAKRIRDELGPEDDRRLVREYTESIQRNGGSS